MSEKKEFKPLDVGASERVPWKIAKGLVKNIGFKEDGSVEVGKNLEVDGTTKLNGGFEPIHTYEFTDEYGINYVFSVFYENYIASSNRYAYVGELNRENQYTLSGFGYYSLDEGKLLTLLINYYDDTNDLYQTAFVKSSDNDIFQVDTDTWLIRDADLKTLFGNQSIVGDGNIDLYRHSITLGGASGSSNYTANIEFISSKNLICDSVTDLKTLINDGTTYLSKIPTSITSGDTSTSGYVLVNSFMAKLSNNTNPSASLAEITTVSDAVTTI